MSVPRAKKMWVVTVDENGKELGDGRWVDIPAPDSFASDGFAQIEGYVSRLLRSSARFTSVIIATPDHRVAVTLRQRGGVPEIALVFVDWHSEAERARAVRQFFAGRGLSASEDYLAGNGTTLCLGYSLPPDVQFITTLTKDVLRQIYQLREQHGLDFTYEEHPAAV